MRYLTLLIITILTINPSHSQINELGIFFGGSNFIGDVGATKYIAPNQTAIGGIYKWNRSKRHSYRVSVIFSDLKGEDLKSEDPRRIQRGYQFATKLTEVSAGMEFTFLDFDLHAGKTIATPYLFAGISVAKHENYYFFNAVSTSEQTDSWAYGIPMGLGFKTNVLGSFILGFEIGVRCSFSDELDGSIPDSKFKQQYRFGNINNNDWYVFSGITLTYTFGKHPCYFVN